MPSDHPAPTLLRPRAPKLVAGSSMRFSTPRVSLPFACMFSRRRPRGSFVRRRLSPTYRTRGPGCYRDLAGRRYRPATLMGFRSTLRSFDPIRGRSRAPRRRLRAHLPFRRPPAASFFVAGHAASSGAHAMGVRPRLLGFAIAPADQPYRVIRRPRHGFYAQGRKRTHRPGLPWVFIVLSQVFGLGLRLPLLEAIPPGLLEPPPATSLQR